MDDPRATEGVEHLQAAARELIAAARSFLDVADDLVEDRDRFSGAAGHVVDLLRGGLDSVVPGNRSSSRLEPWETAAWGSPEASEQDLVDDDRSSERAAAPTQRSTVADGREPVGRRTVRNDPGGSMDRLFGDSVDEFLDGPPVEEGRSERTSRGSRVRRIAVD